MSAKDIIWVSILIGICSIIALPILSDYGFLFPLGRDIIFRIIVEILLGLYIVLIFLDKSFLPKPNWLLWSLIGFWLINGIATINSLQPIFSFWGNPFRGHGFFSLTHYLIFFIILTSVIKNSYIWKKIIWLSIIISLPITLFSLYEILSYVPRTQSTLNNPNFLAAYLLLIFFITLGTLIKEKNRDLRIFLMTALALQFLSLLFTKTRGAYIGLAIGVIAFFFLFTYFKAKKNKKQKLIFWSGIIMLIILFFIILILNGNISWFLNTLSLPIHEVSPRFISIVQRFESYDTAWQGTIEKPLLGVGPENFVIIFDKFYSGSLEATNYRWFDKVHNVFLETSVTTGIFGLLAYLAILFFAFKYGRKDIALIVTLIAYITQNQFNIDATSSLIYFFLWLGLANFLKNNEIK